MKKTYIRPEMEIMEFLGTDTICHASIYDGEGNSVDVIQDEKNNDDDWKIPTDPVWID